MKKQHSIKHARKFRAILAVWLIIRVFIPTVLFYNPIAAWALSQFFDGFDGQLFWESNIRWRIYNIVDKILDYWWYLWIVYFLYTIQHPVFMIAVGLLAFRTFGQLYSTIFNNEKVFLYFPNIFEWFFVYSVLVKLPVIYSLPIAVVTALFVEWLIHKSNLHIVSRYIFNREIVWKK